MEYGTWQYRSEEERKDESNWTAIGRAILKAEGNLGLFGHVRVKSFSCKRVGDAYRFVWRAEIYGEAKVAFVDCVDLVGGFADSLARLDTNRVSWYPDKYA